MNNQVSGGEGLPELSDYFCAEFRNTTVEAGELVYYASEERIHAYAREAIRHSAKAAEGEFAEIVRELREMEATGNGVEAIGLTFIADPKWFKAWADRIEVIANQHVVGTVGVGRLAEAVRVFLHANAALAAWHNLPRNVGRDLDMEYGDELARLNGLTDVAYDELRASWREHAARIVGVEKDARRYR
jgi:hypothetical protein